MNTPLDAALTKCSPHDSTVKQQLQKDAEHFHALIEYSSDLITVLTPDGCVQYASPSSERVLGYAQEDWVGVDIFSYVHPGDEETVRAAFAAALRNLGAARQGEFRFLHRDGSWRVLDTVNIGSRNGAGELRLVMSARDISERVAQTAALRHQALHDVLTDLPNRILFHESLQQAILNAQRYKKPFALLLLDLDRFRDINGAFGHHWGDELLRQVGARLRGALRKSDLIARLGGDEFAVLLPNAGNINGATHVAFRILRVLEHAFVIEEQTINVGASIGIALFPEHGEDAETLLRRADIAMYTAKRTSGGYALYQSTPDHDGPDRLLLAGELRQAIENDHLLLHYQPKASFEDGRVSHVEALVRWRHPQLGLVPPDQFIPLAEQTGLIRPLCLWVVNEALRQDAVWQRQGINLHVAVNLSMRNLQDPCLPDAILKLLARWNLNPTWLEVEITESALAADPERALEILTRLSSLGVRIAIDDFGTGYSSLAYLKRLPVDEVKIDKSFVLGMTADENAATIVRSIIDLGHNLGLKVTAEGIEDQATWELIQSLGCDFAQGYCLSRPLPAVEFAEWIKGSTRGEISPQNGASTKAWTWRVETQRGLATSCEQARPWRP